MAILYIDCYTPRNIATTQDRWGVDILDAYAVNRQEGRVELTRISDQEVSYVSNNVDELSTHMLGIAAGVFITPGAF